MSQSRQPVFNASPVVLTLIAINVSIHVLLLLVPHHWNKIVATLGAFSPPWFLTAMFGGEGILAYVLLLTPFTYAFLHADLVHLILNMAFLLAFGTAVERRLGTGRFLGLYFVCLLFGAAASLALFFITHEQTVMVGASAAISGLFGAVLRLTGRHTFIVIGIFILSNIVIGYTGLPGSDGVRSIAWEAHIGGFLAGLLFLPLFDPDGRYFRRRPS